MFKKIKGFSLLELMISVFVIAIALGAIVSMILLGSDVYLNASYENRALNLAANRIEFLKALSSDSALFYNNFFEDYNSIADYPEFSRLTIVYPNTAGDTKFLKLECRINWQGIIEKREYRLTGVNYYQ